jgi:hypothetical protein
MSERKPKLSEGAIQRAILEYLAARHILAFRMQVGAFSSEYKGKTRFMRVGTAGMADILAFPQERVSCMSCGKWNLYPVPVWLEVKSATGKQSDLQKSFQAQVEREGHRYAVVRSIDDVIEALK